MYNVQCAPPKDVKVKRKICINSAENLAASENICAIFPGKALPIARNLLWVDFAVKC